MSDDPTVSAPQTEAPAAASAGPRKRGVLSRLPLVLALVAVLGVALWSGYWWVATRAIERGIQNELMRLAATGVRIGCADQRVSGFPFRFAMQCTPISAEGADGSSGTMTGLTVTSPAYNPSRMDLAATAPLSARFADGSSAVLAWSLVRASLHFDTKGMTGMAVSVEKPDLRAGGSAPLTADLAELHTSLHPQGTGSDVSLTARDVALPTLEVPGTLKLTAALEDGGFAARADAASFVRRLAQEGTSGRLTEFQLSAGGAELRITGPFAVDSRGELSGSFKVALVDPQRLTDLLARGLGINLPLPSSDSLAGLLSGFGSPAVDGRPALTLPVEVRRGKMTMGFVPLGRLPRLFDPGWFKVN